MFLLIILGVHFKEENMKILNLLMMSSFFLIGWSQFIRANEKEKQHQKEHIIPTAEHGAPKAQGGCTPWDLRCKKN